MTGKTEDFGARATNHHVELAALREECRRILHGTELFKAEWILLKAEYVEFEQALSLALDWPKERPVKWGYRYNKETDTVDRVPKYAKRPARWRVRDGYELVSGVLAIQAKRNCSVAEAIRVLNPELKSPSARRKRRTLERRFQEIKGVWGPWYHWRASLEARARELETALPALLRAD